MKTTLLFALGMFLGAYCYGQDKKTFTKDNILFEYPGHWIVRDFPGQYILVSEPPKEELSVMATFDVAIDSITVDLQEFMLNYSSMMETNEVYSDYIVISEQRVKYLGEDAFELRCTATVQKIPVEWKSMIFARNALIYKLTTTAMTGQLTILQEETDQLFESFELK